MIKLLGNDFILEHYTRKLLSIVLYEYFILLDKHCLTHFPFITQLNEFDPIGKNVHYDNDCLNDYIHAFSECFLRTIATD